MGCRPDIKFTSLDPSFKDIGFFTFRDAWIKLKRQNEVKPYDPDEEIRNNLRSQQSKHPRVSKIKQCQVIITDL